MIVKKIKNPKRSASKSSRTKQLTNYIRSLYNQNQEEKCVYQGSRNFLSDDPEIQQLEMVSLAEQSVRSTNPIAHYVLSWQEGEHPSNPQIEQAVDLFLDTMNWTDHQVIYGVHEDTNNRHLHLAVNQVHPLEGKVIKPRWDITQAHKAIAWIELEQGWKREQRAVFAIEEGIPRFRTRSEREVGQASSPQLSLRAKRNEQDTGAKSAERIAQEFALPILRSATTWQEVHQKLAAEGIRYEKFGSGALVYVGTHRIKASDVHRSCSFGNLVKRLGPYQPAPTDLHPRPRQVEPVVPHPVWRDYVAERNAQKLQKQEALAGLTAQHQAERQGLKLEQKQERKGLRSKSYPIRGQWLLVQRMIAMEQQCCRLELTQKQKQEKRQFHQSNPKFSSFDDWLETRGERDIATFTAVSTTAITTPPGAIALGSETNIVLPQDDWEVTSQVTTLLTGAGTGGGDSADDVDDSVTSWDDNFISIQQQDWMEEENQSRPPQLDSEPEARPDRRFQEEDATTIIETIDLATLRKQYQEQPSNPEGIALLPLLPVSCRDALRGIVGEEEPIRVLEVAATQLYAVENQCLIHGLPIAPPTPTDLITELLVQLALDKATAQSVLSGIEAHCCQLSREEVVQWTIALQRNEPEWFANLPDSLQRQAQVQSSGNLEPDGNTQYPELVQQLMDFRDSLTLNDFRDWYRDAAVLEGDRFLADIHNLALEFKRTGWRDGEFDAERIQHLEQTQMSMTSMKRSVEQRVVKAVRGLLQGVKQRTLSLKSYDLTLRIQGSGAEVVISIWSQGKLLFRACDRSPRSVNQLDAELIRVLEQQVRKQQKQEER